MKKTITTTLLVVLALVLASCGEKKKSETIIAQKVAKPRPVEPIKMQEYSDERTIDWLDKKYHVAIHRTPCDSLPMVKDESGQQYVDNRFRMVVSRQDGSIFFQKTFTKQMLAACLDNDYKKTGVFEGLVFDRVEGDYLVLGASVGHPQTDEYIPLVVRLSRMGQLDIKRDTQLDTNADNQQPDSTSEDI